jgi:hypothetical protein
MIGTLVNKFSCFLISLHFVVLVALVLAGLLLLLLGVEVVVVVEVDEHIRYGYRSDSLLPVISSRDEEVLMFLSMLWYSQYR